MFVTKNLYQNDETWKKTPLGNSSETIGGWGCLLTSVTMMLNGIGYNETPVTANEKFKKAGGFSGALFMPSFLPYVWPNCAYRDMQPCEAYPAPLAQIDAAVAAGKPVILQVDWNKQAGIQTHFVLVKEKKGDDYLLYDPYKYGGDGPDVDVLLTKRYKFNGAKLASEISAVLWFDSYSNTPPEPPKVVKVSVPAEKYVIYAGEDDLSLRAEPSVSGYLWKRMLIGTELLCLEPKAQVKAKLGVQGQWIQIQDPNGDQGYVAAWYVSEQKGKPASSPTPITGSASTASAAPKPGAAPAPKPAGAPAPIPAGAIALFPTEELSLRSQPVISPETLIRRVPASEQLISLEPANQAIAKVGVENQWIKVRDANKKEGYVAAWYVKYAGGSTAQAATATTSTPAAGAINKVKTTIEMVSLRNQPVVSDASLIKRVPINYEFTITEAGGEAKIGANDKWIKVKDATHEGYVAAWFVSR
jgi:uncharacterized protein YgiM (DUF1202 family)